MKSWTKRGYAYACEICMSAVGQDDESFSDDSRVCD